MFNQSILDIGISLSTVCFCVFTWYGKPRDTELHMGTSHVYITSLLQNNQTSLDWVIDTTVDLNPDTLNYVILDKKINKV